MVAAYVTGVFLKCLGVRTGNSATVNRGGV
jgi:hypothetical protein